MTFESIINKRKKDWNCSNLMDSVIQKTGDKIPFSSPLLNYTTYGGIPRNCVTVFYGEPSGGKTSTAIDICKTAYDIFETEYNDTVMKLQEKSAKGDKTAELELEEIQEIGVKKVLYLDLEHAFDAKWSKTLGVDLSKIEIMQPPNIPAEDILNTVLELIESNELGLIVLDSIPSLTTKQELEKAIGERTVASLAGAMTLFMRRVVPLLTRYHTTLLMINQVRDNLDNPYVIQMPGGKAIKFYASLMILFRIGAPVDFLGNELPTNTENPAGYKVTAKITKQKSAPWDRKNGSYFLMAQSGIRVDMDFAQLAVSKYGIIKKSGAWFTICDPETGEIYVDENDKPIKLNGMAKVYDYLQSNQEYYSKLKQYILNDIEHGSDIDLGE